MIAGHAPGSSAGGEQPKFTASVTGDRGHCEVLVKFAPAGDSATAQRRRDLLACEHIALEVLLGSGHPAAVSRLLDTDGWRFLETERFDRIGVRGRVGVVTLFAVDSHFYGHLDNWPSAARRLTENGYLSIADMRQIDLLHAFGGLIGNTDMHFGNISLRHEGLPKFRLAPVYDMLPMRYTPIHESLEERAIDPPPPKPPALEAWRQARALASGYWQRVADDNRVSPRFRELAARNYRVIDTLHF